MAALEQNSPARCATKSRSSSRTNKEVLAPLSVRVGASFRYVVPSRRQVATSPLPQLT